MKKKGKILTICMAALMVLTMTTTVAFAASDNTPATTTADDSTVQSRGHSGSRKDGAGVSVVSVAASVLGMTTDEVKEAVQDSKVGDLLIAAGKVGEFKTAYLAEAKTKLDAAVASGTLTQAEADGKYAEAEAKMAAYDGTTHLCGGTDHSKMGNRKKITDA